MQVLSFGFYCILTLISKRVIGNSKVEEVLNGQNV